MQPVIVYRKLTYSTVAAGCVPAYRAQLTATAIFYLPVRLCAFFFMLLQKLMEE